MQVIITLIHIVFLFFVAARFYPAFRHTALKSYYVPALLVKLYAGIAVGLIYKYHYQGGDTFAYFHDAVSFSNLFFQSPVTYIKALCGIYPEGWQGELHYLHQERALLTARILSLFTLVSHNNYWISGLYFSLLSFLGMFYLAKQIAAFTRHPPIIAGVAFLFSPSVVFWSSGVLKEPLVMCCLCLIAGIYLPYLLADQRTPLWKVLASFLLAWLLWKIKYYYAAVLFPLLLAGLVSAYVRNRIPFVSTRFFAQAGIALAVFVALLGFISIFHPNLNLSGVLEVIVRNHDRYLLLPDPGRLIHFKGLEPSLMSFLQHLPLAIFSGLFRPAVFDAGSPFQYFVAFENSLLLLLFISALFGVKKRMVPDHKLALLLLVFYILLLAAILPIASPNMGTLVRHKTGFLPFFIYLIMISNPLVAKLKRLVRCARQ